MPQNISFPWGMFFLALFFDAIGLIPILNIFTEIMACLIFGLWQKGYSPASDPLFALAATKIADIVFLGLLPSNVGIVLIAHGKKKAVAKISSSSNIMPETAVETT